LAGFNDEFGIAVEVEAGRGAAEARTIVTPADNWGELRFCSAAPEVGAE